MSTTHHRETPFAARRFWLAAGLLGALSLGIAAGAQAEAPVVEKVQVMSAPKAAAGYNKGEQIEVAVSFSAPLPDAPAWLYLQIGNRYVAATPQEDVKGKEELSFFYQVRSGDKDKNGISVPANALWVDRRPMPLNGNSAPNLLNHQVDANVAAERVVLKDAMAAQARGQLGSAVDVISRRLHNRATRDTFDLAWTAGKARDFASAYAHHGKVEYSYRNLAAEGFTLPLNAGRAATGLVLWGAGDVRRFRASTDNGSYDGSLISYYGGADTQLAGGWLMGLAVGESLGETTYDYTHNNNANSGEIQTEIFTAYPYLRGEVREGTEVWGMLGIGSGEARLSERRNNNAAVANETGDLSFMMAAFGGTHRLGRFGGTDVSLLGDAGYAKQEADDSNALDHLSASAGRLRLGLKSDFVHDAWSSSWHLSGRYDGGNGSTGIGMELGGGLFYTGSRLSGSLQGNWLAAHAESSTDEYSFSGSLEWRARTGGIGWWGRVTPIVEAGKGSADGLIWSDDSVHSLLGGGDDVSWNINSAAGYGIAVPNAGVVTPLYELSTKRDWARHYYGVRLTRKERTNLWLSIGVSREIANSRRVNQHKGLSLHMVF